MTLNKLQKSIKKISIGVRKKIKKNNSNQTCKFNSNFILYMLMFKEIVLEQKEFEKKKLLN